MHLPPPDIKGWNTWNTRSVLSHVLLPSTFSLSLGLKEYRDGAFLREALIGRQTKHCEQIRPGPRSWDGSYTSLDLSWRDIRVRIESATAGEDLVILATPLLNQRTPASLTIEAGFLWNREGAVTRESSRLTGRSGILEINAWPAGTLREDPHIDARGACLILSLESPCGISTGKARTLREISTLIEAARQEQTQARLLFGKEAEIHDAIQTCLAWDSIHDPLRHGPVSPVSRIWNVNHGGYVLFCWDTFLAAWMASLGSKDLAYANILAITRELTEDGFIPNFANPGMKSRDRSQPPVGSLVLRELFRKFRDRWLVEDLFDPLLQWNRWWQSARLHNGLLCWGSNPYPPTVGNHWEIEGVNRHFGAALESGLDNSPMFDGVPFNPQTHLLEMADAGLNGLYAMDCDCLADLARVLGKKNEENELRQRGDATRKAMDRLWCAEKGTFLNRRTDTGEFDPRLSPTLFYPLLGGAASPKQAEEMVRRHFFNPKEFAGDWILPSISRDDPAYPDQTYWRGRIWPPLNLLVYLGLRRYNLSAARRELAQKSAALLLKEWREHGHVHENYNADTGEGCDRENSDRFYHWGGLLGLPALMEAGHLPGPEEPL